MPDINEMTFGQIEEALIAGFIFIRMPSGNEYQCRRNGPTVKWPAIPGAFKIPFRAKNKIRGNLRHDNLDHFTIKESN